MLLLLARLDLGAMAIKRYSTFPKAPAGASPSDYLVSYPGHSLGKSYSSAKTQSVNSTALADWVRFICKRIVCR